MPKLYIYVLKYTANYCCKSSWYKRGNTKWNFKLKLVINIKNRNDETIIFLSLFLYPKEIPTLFLLLGFFILNPSSNPPFCLKSSCLYCLDPSSQSLDVAFLDNLNTSYPLLFYDTQCNCVPLSMFLVCITVITLHSYYYTHLSYPWNLESLT